MRNGSSPTQGKTGFDIWAMGKQLQMKENPQGGQEKTIIVLGDHNSGKSSFVKILRADSDTEVKPTGALEYTFIRKSAVRKELVHSYEVAGKNLRGIIQSLINKQNYSNLMFVIVVDLSTPAEALDSAAEWLQIVKDQVNRFIQSKLEEAEQRAYIEGVVGKYANHEDSSKIEPLLIQTVVIGNKYDLYEKYDPEVRKWISRSLRYISLANGCSLIYCSIRVPQLTAQVRSIFQTLFFGENPSNLNLSQKDHMKPVFIISGHDSFSSMTLPHPGSMSMVAALRKQISALVPPKQEKKNEEFNFAKYKETRVDSLVEEKQKELEKISKDYKVIRSEKVIDSPDRPHKS